VTKLLAIETTERWGSVAVSENGGAVRALELTREKRSTESLVPAIQTLLQQADWEIQSLDIIAVATGPGSFTGLRVGLATARMLAYAVHAKIFGINTLQAIAVNAAIHADISGIAAGQRITTAVDAQRGDVSAQTFQFVPSRYFPNQLFPEPIDERRLMSWTDWLRLTENKEYNTEKPLLFSSPLLQKIAAQKITTQKNAASPTAHAALVDASLWNPNAIGVSQIAWERENSGESDNLWTLQPYYSRLSAAEEKMKKKE